MMKQRSYCILSLLPILLLPQCTEKAEMTTRSPDGKAWIRIRTAGTGEEGGLGAGKATLAAWYGRPDGGVMTHFCLSDRAETFLPVDTGRLSLFLWGNPPDPFPYPAPTPIRPDSLTADLCACGRDRLPMSGRLDTLISHTGKTRLCVSLNQLTARVSLASLRNELSQSGYETSELVLRDIYLINGVCRDGVFAHRSTAYEAGARSRWWYNRSGREPGEPETARMGRSGSPLARLGSGATWIPTESLYTFPNYEYVTDRFGSEGDVWLPRATRLVIETELSGEIRYYPITLPRLEAGRWYRIGQVRLRRPGLLHPDAPTVNDILSFPVEIVPWNNHPIYEAL